MKLIIEFLPNFQTFHFSIANLKMLFARKLFTHLYYILALLSALLSAQPRLERSGAFGAGNEIERQWFLQCDMNP